MGLLDAARHGGCRFASGFAGQLLARGLRTRAIREEMRERLIKCKGASPCHRWTCGLFAWCGPLECQLHCCVANRFNFAARAYTIAERCSHSIISTVIHPTASSRQSSNHDWHAAQLCRNHQARVGSAVATAAREQGREIEFCSFQRLPTTGKWSIKLHQSVIRGM